MEGEQSTQHTESDEDEGEERILNLLGNVVHSSNLVDIHRGVTAEVVDTQHAENQQSRTTHQHQRQLHGRILLAARTPHTNQEVHRNQSHLIEHEHGEHVGADEETKHTRRKQGEPKEILLGKRLQLPRGEGTREHDDT